MSWSTWVNGFRKTSLRAHAGRIADRVDDRRGVEEELKRELPHLLQVAEPDEQGGQDQRAIAAAGQRQHQPHAGHDREPDQPAGLTTERRVQQAKHAGRAGREPAAPATAARSRRTACPVTRPTPL